jgi:hypothetical protein
MSAGDATVTPMEVPTAEELAKSQADLNEYVAYIIMGEAFNELRYVYRALDALAFHNLAAGFTAEFSYEKPPRDPEWRQRCARRAVNEVGMMNVMSRLDDIRARDAADDFQGWVPDDAASLSSAPGGALVYLITHAKLAAAKIGIADMSGLRLAQHRRKGWADPGGIPGERQVCRRDRGRCPEVVACRAWLALVPHT